MSKFYCKIASCKKIPHGSIGLVCPLQHFFLLIQFFSLIQDIHSGRYLIQPHFFFKSRQFFGLQLCKNKKSRRYLLILENGLPIKKERFFFLLLCGVLMVQRTPKKQFFLLSLISFSLNQKEFKILLLANFKTSFFYSLPFQNPLVFVENLSF